MLLVSSKCVRIFCFFCFILSSVLQTLTFAFCSKIFQNNVLQISIILFFTNLCMLLIFGSFIVYVHFFCSGFLPEVKSKIIQKSFFFIGFCNAIAKACEIVSFSCTSLLLRCSFSHMIIPFVISIIITSNVILKKFFFGRALAGSFFIVFGSLMHLSIIYLHIDEKEGFDMLWWNIIGLIGNLFYALSSVYQQRCYAIRRINVFYMLFYTNLTQFIFFSLFLLLIFIRGIVNKNLSFVVNFDCLSGGLILTFFIFFSFLSQILQIFIVRQLSYKAVSYAILAIPTILFFTFCFSLEKNNLFSLNTNFFPFILQTCCYSITLYGAYVYRLENENDLSKEFIFPADPFFKMHIRDFNLYAPFLFFSNGRIHAQNCSLLYNCSKLCRFSFPSSFFLKPYKKSVSSMLSFKIKKKKSSTMNEEIFSASTLNGLEKEIECKVDDENNIYGASTLNLSNQNNFNEVKKGEKLNNLFFSNLNLLEKRNTKNIRSFESSKEEKEEKEKKEIKEKKEENVEKNMDYNKNFYEEIEKPKARDKKKQKFSTAKLKERSKSDEIIYKEENNMQILEINTKVCPFYLPSPLPHATSFLTIVRPVLMNVWSGNILCEYTDYKRNYDSSLIFSNNKMDFNEFDCDFESLLLLPWRKEWSALKQYTKTFMNCLGDTEEALRRLYAYHRMGTLAASMAAQYTSDEVSTPSSQTSNISWPIDTD